jgi:hypothetical protein
MDSRTTGCLPLPTGLAFPKQLRDSSPKQTECGWADLLTQTPSRNRPCYAAPSGGCKSHSSTYVRRNSRNRHVTHFGIISIGMTKYESGDFLTPLRYKSPSCNDNKLSLTAIQETHTFLCKPSMLLTLSPASALDLSAALQMSFSALFLGALKRIFSDASASYDVLMTMCSISSSSISDRGGL